MKKLLILSVIFLCLTGCGKNESGDFSSEKNSQNETVDTTKNENDSDNIEVEAVPAIEVETGEIVLRNAVDSEILNTYKLNEKQYAKIIGEFNGGYCVGLYTANRKLENKDIDGVVVSDIPGGEEIDDISFIFFDEKLNELEELKAKDAFDNLDNEEMLSGNFSISKDGNVVAYNNYGEIECYNKKTKEFKEYKQLEEENIDPDLFTFVGNDKIAFTCIDEDGMIYGYIQFDDSNVHVYKEKDYNVFSIYSNDRYIWFNDSIDNLDNGSTSGRFVFVDTKTNENKVINLEGHESTNATLSDDGKNVIAVNQEKDNSFRVRQYDFETGEVVKEKEYNFKSTVKVLNIYSLKNDNIYALSLVTENENKVEFFKVED